MTAPDTDAAAPLTPSPIGAFFDLDKTLLRVNSATVWLRYLWDKGELGLKDVVRSAGWLLRYRFALIDMADISREVLGDLKGIHEASLRDEIHAWYQARIRQHFYDEARAKVEAHRADGHQLILLTAASPYIAELVTDELRLDAFLCTRLEVRDGHFTGRPVEPLCYGPGKIHWAEQLAAERGIDLDQSYFYSDSFTDLPMLQRVGHPIATNPDPRLRRFAQRAGMEVLDFGR